jgi:hypothetical protein
MARFFLLIWVRRRFFRRRVSIINFLDSWDLVDTALPAFSSAATRLETADSIVLPITEFLAGKAFFLTAIIFSGQIQETLAYQQHRIT